MGFQIPISNILCPFYIQYALYMAEYPAGYSARCQAGYLAIYLATYNLDIWLGLPWLILLPLIQLISLFQLLPLKQLTLLFQLQMQRASFQQLILQKMNTWTCLIKWASKSSFYILLINIYFGNKF